jgi:hypothetical protein
LLKREPKAKMKRTLLRHRTFHHFGHPFRVLYWLPLHLRRRLPVANLIFRGVTASLRVRKIWHKDCLVTVETMTNTPFEVAALPWRYPPHSWRTSW